MRLRLAGVAVAASATFATGISLSPPVQAATVWDRVAACESGGRWHISTGNGYSGGLQFSAATWAGFGGTRYARSAHRASKAVQIAIAKRVLRVQGPGAWPVCGPRAGLARAGGGAFVSRSRARSAIAATGRLAVDGRFGPKTIRATQRWTGTTANGIYAHRTVRALQRRVGVRADGANGPRTMRALQTRVGARRDGARRLNRATVVALQRYLNRH